MKKGPYPYLGFGLGLRVDHYQDILDTQPNVDWFEILTENYLVPGGKPLHFLNEIRQHYPMVMHGVSLSIGSTDPLNMDYLKQVKQLADHIEPQWISDHLCWTGVEQKNLHDLLPLPYTEEAIEHVSQRIKQVQDYLGQQILIENVSSYLSYTESALTEWDFLAEIAQQADCLILLDINNIHVSSVNHNFHADDYLQAMPIQRVQQFHLAGHTRYEHYIIDTHDHDIVDEVWQLYAKAVERFGRVSCMIERDDNIPPFKDLLAELEKAKKIAQPIYETLSA